ncbi:hypothetical protein MTO96_040268, partial [Rhipicephalus appendiculatus]
PNHVCGRSFYTYCTVLNQEAYYSAREGGAACSPQPTRCACATGPPTGSPASMRATTPCGRMHGPMADRCFEKTLFTDCDRQDVWHSWWVFSGEDCVQWSFPRGLCPDDDGSDVAVFADESSCVERCISSKDSKENRGCRQPKAKSCHGGAAALSILRRHTGKSGGHCVKATVENLLMHRCLIGANRFNSVRACREACERRKT